ncbi:MAG: hypothetical protein BGO95_09690 [Micrococcales bacterium 73-13]|nr:MAG: hypothetical protein BGO95_09690 [Micrococcales bacterium 73-13]
MFASELTTTVQSVLPDSPEFLARVNADATRLQLSPFEADGETAASMPLFIGGEKVAVWRLTMLLDLDSSGEYLKVTKSNFALSALVDRTPLVRFEFDDAMHTAPAAHWQFHGERGAFSFLLGIAKANHKDVKPHSLASLHFPVGGARMRPGVADLLEFLVRECGFDALEDWEQAIREDRARYRTIQARTIARDMQAEVAAVLKAAGWDVSPPADVVETGTKFLRGW